MDHSLERLVAGFAEDRRDRRRVVVDGDLLERPHRGGQVDRAAPVLGPDVVAGVEEGARERLLGWCAIEHVRSHRAAVRQKHWPTPWLPRTTDLVKGAKAAVAGLEADNPSPQACRPRQIVPFARLMSLPAQVEPARRGPVGVVDDLRAMAVELYQLADEVAIELRDRADAGWSGRAAHRREHAREAEPSDVKDSGRHGRLVPLGLVLVVAAEDPDQQARGVAPTVEIRTVLDVLEAAQGQRPTVAVTKEQAVEHAPLELRAADHEQVEPAALDPSLAAPPVAADCG